MIVVGRRHAPHALGLSITEWQPIVGTLPPLSEAEWQVAFAKYQATPEYQLVNHGMTLPEFKGIFWWEYFHRLLGRLIGVVFLVPFAVVRWRRAIPPGYGWQLAGIFVLGGLQGAMGWYMVKSGLVDDPARVAVPADGASPARVRDPRRDAVGGAVAARSGAHARHRCALARRAPLLASWCWAS